MHRLQRLNDRYPGLFNRWLTRNVVRRDIGVLKQICHWWTRVLLPGLVYYKKNLSAARKTDMLQVCLAAASSVRGIGKVLQHWKGAKVRGPELILRKLSEIALKRADDDFRNLVLKRIKIAAVISRILALVVPNLRLWLFGFRVGCWLTEEASSMGVMDEREEVYLIPLPPSKPPATCCHLSDIPPCQSVAQGRLLVCAAYKSRHMRYRCKNSWSHQHPHFWLPQALNFKLNPASRKISGEKVPRVSKQLSSTNAWEPVRRCVFFELCDTPSCQNMAQSYFVKGFFKNRNSCLPSIKMFDHVIILLLRCLRHQTINLVRQVDKDLGDGSMRLRC